jgi:hypothetical protein
MKPTQIAVRQLADQLEMAVDPHETSHESR